MALLVALVIDAYTLIILRKYLHGTWLRRPFPVLILTAMIYHGLSEVVELVPSVADANPYRRFVPIGDIHLGALLVSVAMLATSGVYLLSLGKAGRHARPDLSGIKDVLGVLDWRIISLLTLPLAIYTYGGTGYSSGLALNVATMPPLQVAAASFFVILMVMSTFSFICRYGIRTFIPAIAIQSILMAAAGQRLEILVGAVAVAVLLAAYAKAPSLRQLLASALVGLALVSAISTVRGIEGRRLFYSDSGLTERVVAIATAVLSEGPGAGPHGAGPLAEAAIRFDANEWMGAVVGGLEERGPIGLGPLVRLSGSIIPSSFFGGKNDRPLSDRDPETAQIEYFGLARLDHIPGDFGMLLGFTGVVLFVPLLALFGFLFAKIERWVYSRATAARIVCHAFLVVSALFFEKGTLSFLVAVRFAIPIGIMVFIVQSLTRRMLPRREAGHGGEVNQTLPRKGYQ